MSILLNKAVPRPNNIARLCACVYASWYLALGLLGCRAPHGTHKTQLLPNFLLFQFKGSEILGSLCCSPSEELSVKVFLIVENKGYDLPVQVVAWGHVHGLKALNLPGLDWRSVEDGRIQSCQLWNGAWQSLYQQTVPGHYCGDCKPAQAKTVRAHIIHTPSTQALLAKNIYTYNNKKNMC